jgi:hypothetical protein
MHLAVGGAPIARAVNLSRKVRTFLYKMHIVQKRPPVEVFVKYEEIRSSQESSTSA